MRFLAFWRPGESNTGNGGQPESFERGASLFGWAADGAVVNGTRLMGRVFLGMAVARDLRAKPLPAALAKWAQLCSHIVATSVAHGSKKSQIVSMWKDTVISHKLNERLNPIMQCTSVVGTKCECG